MNATPFVLGAISTLLGVLLIVFRKSWERDRDAQLRDVGEHTELTIRILRRIRFTILTGCGFILIGVLTILSGLFPL